MLGKVEDKRREERQRIRLTDSMDVSLNKLQERERKTGKPGVVQLMGS